MINILKYYLLIICSLLCFQVKADIDFAQQGAGIGGLITQGDVNEQLKLDSIHLNIHLRKNGSVNISASYFIFNLSNNNLSQNLFFIDGGAFFNKKEIEILFNKEKIKWEPKKLDKWPQHWYDTISFLNPLDSSPVVEVSPINNEYADVSFNDEGLLFNPIFVSNVINTIEIKYVTKTHNRTIDLITINLFSYLLEPAKRWVGDKKVRISISKENNVYFYSNIDIVNNKKLLSLNDIKNSLLIISFNYKSPFYNPYFPWIIAILLPFLLIFVPLKISKNKIINIISLILIIPFEVVIFFLIFIYYYRYTSGLFMAHLLLYALLINITTSIVVFLSSREIKQLIVSSKSRGYKSVI